MNKTKLIGVVVVLLFVLFGGVQEAKACSCSSQPPIYTAFESADAVFTGKAIDFKDIVVKEKETDDNENEEKFKSKERIFSFEISEIFKGVREKNIEVSVGSTTNSCYRGFDVGESYLIYAYKKDSKFVHGFCSRSGTLEHSQSQIHFIKEFLNGKKEAQIYGLVERRDTYPNSVKNRFTRLEGLKITLEGKEKSFEVLTDKDGAFKFNKIPDGGYELIHKPNSKYKVITSFIESGNLKIKNGKIATDSWMGFVDFYDSFFSPFTLVWDNEVTGKVFDSEGKPVKFAAVRLLPVSIPYQKIESNKDFDESDEGEYSCYSETPGNYYLVADIFSPFETKEKIRIFYPQSETPEKATSINLKAIDKLKLDFILPAKFITREIKGKVISSEGQVIENAKVSLQKTENFVVTENSDEILDNGYDVVETDEEGNFVLQAFENAEYWIHFEVENEEEKIIKGKPIQIKVGKINEPLKLILTKP